MTEKERVGDSFEQLERFERGRRLFNDGRFFEAHEEWETAWMGEEGAARILLQGLIQIAAGCHKAEQGQSIGCARLIGAGLEKLARAGALSPEIDSFAQAMASIHDAALRWQRGERDGVGTIPLLAAAAPPTDR